MTESQKLISTTIAAILVNKIEVIQFNQNKITLIQWKQKPEKYANKKKLKHIKITNMFISPILYNIQ